MKLLILTLASTVALTCGSQFPLFNLHPAGPFPQLNPIENFGGQAALISDIFKQPGAPKPQATPVGSRNSIPTDNQACPQQGTPDSVVTDFAWTLFRASQSANRDANLVLSPTTVQFLLSVLANGASGQTYNELCRVARFGNAEVIGNMIERLVAPRGEKNKDEVSIGNAVFVAEGTQLKEPFRVALEGPNTRIQTVPFVGNNKDKTIREINSWAAEITRGNINQILDPKGDYSDTKLLLSSAVYFRGSWQYKFKPWAYQQKFKAGNGREVSAQFMNLNREIKVGEVYSEKIKKDVGRYVELPYSGDRRFSMLVVLPFEPYDLNTLIDSFNVKEVIDRVTGFGGINEVNITMPKFEIRSSQSLVNPLSQMGLSSIFGQSALFPNMLETRNAAVSDITQDAFLTVDEMGTQAAGVTTVNVVALSATYPEETVQFVVDRPFLSIIIDREQKIPLFISKITNPSV